MYPEELFLFATSVNIYILRGLEQNKLLIIDFQK